MESEKYDTPLIVIVGTTGSGKSALAMDIAKRINGEIICADSRTIYKGMDIGTAKPSPIDRADIPHYMLDVITPDQKFSVAEFKSQTLKLINDIGSRNKVPILVGGSGLYVDAVIFDFVFLPPSVDDEREKLQQLSVSELHQIISARNIRMPENSQNPRHLIRAIETNGAVAVKKDIRRNTLMLGIDVSKEELSIRLSARIESMIENGLKNEVRDLYNKYGWSAPGMSAVGYQEWREYFGNGCEVEAVLEKIHQNTMQYAKRQRTWFKRNVHINWIKSSSNAYKHIDLFLQKKTSD